MALYQSRPDARGTIRQIEVCSLEACPLPEVIDGNPHNFGHVLPVVTEFQASPDQELASEWFEIHKGGSRNLRFLHAGAAACAQCSECRVPYSTIRNSEEKYIGNIKN